MKLRSMSIVVIVLLASLTAVYITIPVVRSAVSFAAWRVWPDVAVTQGAAENDGVLIRFTTYGAGPPLVLLHGGLSSSLDWIGEIPTLARQFQLIVVDLRGHGESTMDAAEFSYRLFATDVLAVLDKLGIERASMAGWSDGGNVGLLFALLYPSRIERLIAISANFHPDGVSSEILEQNAQGPDDSLSRVGRWIHRLTSPAPEKWPQLMRRVRVMWSAYPQLTTDDLQNVIAPTLVIIGSEDYIEYDHASEMAESIPHAKLVVIANVGHAVLRDAPANIIEQISGFLGGVHL